LCTEAQKYLLSGIVKDASTGKPLVSASVGVEGTTKGTYTDATGHYKIELEKGNYVVEYWYLGYKSFKYSVSLQSNQRKDVALQTEYLEIEKVSVVGQRPDFNVTSTNVGVQTLNMQEIKQTPVLFGENDPLKTLQLMPGVKSAGEGGSGFYVRGGGADQNLILLDEAQDTNPVTLSIFHDNNCARILVGDTHQSIYAFRGAVNALADEKADITLRLSHSFRSKQKILDRANFFLRRYFGHFEDIVDMESDYES